MECGTRGQKEWGDVSPQIAGWRRVLFNPLGRYSMTRTLLGCPLQMTIRAATQPEDCPRADPGHMSSDPVRDNGCCGPHAAIMRIPSGKLRFRAMVSTRAPQND